MEKAPLSQASSCTIRTVFRSSTAGRRNLRIILFALLIGIQARSGCFVLGQEKPGPRSGTAPIQFALQTLPFRVESDETPKFPHAPATMAGGVAVFDYNRDGRPDIFFANGANIETLKKDSPKFSNHLYRNDGNGVFTDVTKEAGLTGSGYDMCVAVGDYDNDGYPDLFVGGVHGEFSLMGEMGYPADESLFLRS